MVEMDPVQQLSKEKPCVMRKTKHQGEIDGLQKGEDYTLQALQLVNTVAAP